MPVCSLLTSAFCMLVILTWQGTNADVQPTVSRPPKITHQSPKDVYYKVGETVKMDCEAEGHPHPGFIWKRNTIPFNPSGNDDRFTQIPKKGTLVINRPEDKDEAIYQCFAKNSFGTAASVQFNLRMAKLDEFKDESPIYHKVPLGGYLKMSCQSPDSVPDPQIYWEIEGNDSPPIILDWNSSVSMDYEDRIHFAHVTKENYQNGNPYRCVAYNKKMRSNQIGPPHYIIPQGATEQRSDIRFVWPPSRFNQFALVGDRFKLMKCIFAGNPTPIVKWKRADNKPFSNRISTANSDGQELNITNVQFEDAGSYVCEANADGARQPVQMSFNLTVQSKPTWNKQPKDVVVGQGATAVFECAAWAEPKPEINWYVNGQRLEEAMKFDKRLNSRFKKLDSTKVLLEQVTKEDAMVFQCNATNIHGYVWGEAYLNVLDQAPHLRTEAKKVIKVAEGQPFEVVCEVSGKPDPIITWFKDDVQITGGRFVVRESGNIYVQVAVLSDAGIYRCNAVNAFGRISANAGTVNIRRKTLIENPPRDLEVLSQDYAKFTCSGTTDPEEINNLKVIWMKDYKVIQLGEKFFRNPQDNSLIISGVQVRDTGTLTCILTNGLDNNTASARLEVTDVPDQPYDVRVNNTCKVKNISEVIWIPGSFNNAPFQYFTVEYVTTKDPDNWIFAKRVTQTTKSIAFIELKPGLNYNFRVISVNKAGSSLPSLTTTKQCETVDDRPSQNPRHARTIGDEPGYIHLEWMPVLPKYQGGNGFQYYIHIRKEGEPLGSTFFQTTISDWKVYSKLILAGVEYEAYHITIKSQNDLGDCFEQPVQFIGHSAESMPIISPTEMEAVSLSGETVLLKWKFPRSEIEKKIGSQIRGEFNGFQIQLWERGRRLETIKQWMIPAKQFRNVNSTINLRDFNYTIKHNIPSTLVEADVAVVNSFYIGKPSDIISFSTPPGLPGPVRYMEAEIIGDNHITIRWERPLDDRSDIIGYDIGYQKVMRGLELGEMQEIHPAINDPFMSKAMVDGLLPLTKYRIHIWVKTAQGRGESYFIERATKDPRPLMVPSYHVTHIGKHSINVSWHIDQYMDSSSVLFVEYKKKDGAEWFSTSPELSYNWVNIPLLQQGMMYQVRVVVTNGMHKMVSIEEDVETRGNAAAYDVIENLGWFLAIVFSLLVHLALVVLFCIAYKRGFRFKTHENEKRAVTYRQGGETYTGTDYNKDRIGHTSRQNEPDPRGYSNDYVDHDSYGHEGNEKYKDFDERHNYDDYGSDEKPPVDNNPQDYDYEDYNKNGSSELPPKPYHPDDAYGTDDVSGNQYDYDRDGYNYDNRYNDGDDNAYNGSRDYDGYYDDQGKPYGRGPPNYDYDYEDDNGDRNSQRRGSQDGGLNGSRDYDYGDEQGEAPTSSTFV